MARLHEYQGKAILKKHGIAVPRGAAAATPDEARRIASEIGGGAVVKIQAWTTNRKALGGVAFTKSADEAAQHAQRMLEMKVGNFPVTHVLVEEKLPIKDELFVSLFIDDRERAPAMLLSLVGGSGIEERARDASVVRRLACDVTAGPDEREVRSLLSGSKIAKELHDQIVGAVKGVFAAARTNEARSVEINPLVTTTDGRVLAADCRMTIDDYAVFRHPGLGIDIARELDHPPTALERVAYQIEQEDHRGTFFFAQMNTQAPPPPAPGSRGLIGFHGAGGGGSMMSMDAITAENFTIANFCDTSGNPSSAKVYRAVRIILMQPGLIGYFGSGSGVANQEQFWSAYGLAKAFWEMNLDIPAVIRLGGNTEDRAVEILEDACKGLPAKVEGYKKDDTPKKIAHRFAELVEQAQRAVDRASGPDGGEAKHSALHHPPPGEDARSTARSASPGAWTPRLPRRPLFVGQASSLSFPLKNGRLWIDATRWDKATAEMVARFSNGLIKDSAGKPVISVSEQELTAKDSELIGCEVECRRAGRDVVFVEMGLPELPGSR